MRDLLGVFFRDEETEGNDEVTYYKLTGDLTQAIEQVREFSDDWADVIELGEEYGVLDQFSANADEELISLDSYEIQGEDRQKVYALIEQFLTKMGLTFEKVDPPKWAVEA